MRFYYYKDNNKKEIRKIDRDNICEDINATAKGYEYLAEFNMRKGGGKRWVLRKQI